MNHQHQWEQISAVGHSSGDGTGRLMTVSECCTICGVVADHYQSASNAEWHRTILQEQVVRDEDGQVIASFAI